MRRQTTNQFVFWLALLWLTIGVVEFNLGKAQDSLRGNIASTDPGIQVILRMDRNLDGLLQRSEIPSVAEDFVNETIGKYDFTSKADVNNWPINLSALTVAPVIIRAEPVPKMTIDANRIRDYGKTLINGYDKNRDGVLSCEEGQDLCDSWDQLDYDRDGNLTIPELTVWLQTINHPGSNETTSTPPERFDLPAEFIKLDENLDGQIQMHEFTDEWTGPKLQEFNQLDSNRDAIITLQEWLLHQVENETTPKKMP